MIWIVLCALIYAALLGSFLPWDLGVGLAIGAAIVFGVRDRARVRIRLIALPRLVGFTALSVARGTLQMLRLVFGSGEAEHAGFVRVPRWTRTEAAVALSGLLATLAPGTVFVEEDGSDLIFHVVDAEDPDAVCAALQRAYEDYERPALAAKEER